MRSENECICPLTFQFNVVIQVRKIAFSLILLVALGSFAAGQTCTQSQFQLLSATVIRASTHVGIKLPSRAFFRISMAYPWGTAFRYGR
jgi:hypothetical protein